MIRRSNGGARVREFRPGLEQCLWLLERILAWILVLANMISNLMKDSLDRAEAYVFSPLFFFSFHLLIILFQVGRPSTGQLVFNAKHK